MTRRAHALALAGLLVLTACQPTDPDDPSTHGSCPPGATYSPPSGDLIPTTTQLDGAYAVVASDPTFRRITSGLHPHHQGATPIEDPCTGRLIGLQFNVHLGTTLTDFDEKLPQGDFGSDGPTLVPYPRAKVGRLVVQVDLVHHRVESIAAGPDRP